MILEKFFSLGFDSQIEKITSWLVYDPGNPLLFSNYLFLGFFLVFYFVFLFTKKHFYFRSVYILCFSLFFYYKAGGLFFLLLLFLSLVNYVLTTMMYNAETKNSKKAYLTFIVCVNLFFLGYFKYTNFILDNFNTLIDSNFAFQDIILPIGISFFTFQAISYAVDLYRKEIEPAISLLDFSFYLCFFPQLVAGPIVRAKEFLPQIRKNLTLSRQNASAALFMIMTGLIKKAVISDYISLNFVDRIFDSPLSYTSFENLMAAYGYTLQIYCDFSGYSDMAIGIALLMGFTLPQNFNSPYKATSLSDFWRRWHISLSQWLRDYLYIPMGGNRKGNVRTYVNLFLTMLIGGLWHGPAWKFVMWGGLHGAGLAVERFLKQFIKMPDNYLTRFISILFTFNFVTFCWIFFRAGNFNDAFLVIDQIKNLHFDIDNWSIMINSYKNVFILISVGYLLHFCPQKIADTFKLAFEKTPMLGKSLAVGFVFWIVYATASSGSQPFIYFQF